MLTHNDIITTITVAQSGMMDIDSDTNMSMTAVDLWENIDHTDTPWNPIELIQNDYGTRLYYTHPQSGNPYTIDLFFDSAGKDANLIRIDIMVQF